MARTDDYVPKLRRHRASGRAVITLNGQDYYLGTWSTGQRRQDPEVKAACDRIVGEWLAAGRHLDTGDAISINQVILLFWKFAERHYRDPDGKPTKELASFKYSFRPLRKAYGMTAAKDF